MRHIDVSEISKILDNQPTELSVMFIGDTGIGKTQVIKRYAEEHNIYLKTLILSQIEASEALGIPVQSKRIYNGREVNTIETAVPSWVFDLAEHPNAILYLDEFLCADPSVMNSFLNFITEKSVNGIDLTHVRIVASTNIGNYTYDPDNNILSRFSMIYVENKNYNAYLKKKYGTKVIIDNDYKDEEELDNVLFEKRSLKPRCQEMLYLVSDSEVREIFYEGYTNTLMIPTFHNNAKIQSVIKTFAVKEDAGWTIHREDYATIAGMLYETLISARRKNLEEYATTYKHLSYDQRTLQTMFKNLRENRDNSEEEKLPF